MTSKDDVVVTTTTPPSINDDVVVADVDGTTTTTVGPTSNNNDVDDGVGDGVEMTYITPEMKLHANASPGYQLFYRLILPPLFILALIVGPPILYTSNDPTTTTNDDRIQILQWENAVLKQIESYRMLATTTTTADTDTVDDTDTDDLNRLPLQDIVILITGATSGIGKGLTKWTYDKGATIIALGRSEEKLQNLHNELLVMSPTTTTTKTKTTTNTDDDDEEKNTTTTNPSPSPPRFFAVVADIIDLRSVGQAADAMIEAGRTAAEATTDGTTSTTTTSLRFPTIILNDEGSFPNKVDILVNNAGMHLGVEALWDLEPTSIQGYDLVFAVNYLSHFLLTEKLLGTLLAASQQPRVVQVTSTFHFAVDGSDLFPTVKTPTREEGSCSSKMTVHDDDDENDEFAGVCSSVSGSTSDRAPVASIPGGSHGFYMYMGQRQYANSKLAQILHARYLSNKFGKARNNNNNKNSSNITFTSACPAWVGTSIIRADEDSLLAQAFRALAFPSDGFGLSSILRAMFTVEEEDGKVEGESSTGLQPADYFISTGFFQYGRKIDDYLLEHTALSGRRYSEMTPRTWSYEWLPVRDLVMYLVSILLLSWQRVWPVLDTAQSSRASYDEQLQQELYEWSYDAVKEWL